MKTLKPWFAPKLIEHGSVEAITHQVKQKRLGSSDDFGITGISDP
jgi:hypothetical protein